jgi:hypothetical protein
MKPLAAGTDAAYANVPAVTRTTGHPHLSGGRGGCKIDSGVPREALEGFKRVAKGRFGLGWSGNRPNRRVRRGGRRWVLLGPAV